MLVYRDESVHSHYVVWWPVDEKHGGITEGVEVSVEFDV